MVRRVGAAVTVAAVLAGCGVSREVHQAQIARTDELQALHRLERERADRLQADLLQLLRTIEALLSEREQLQARIARLESSLAETEAARAELMKLNAELAGQRARLSQITRQMSDTWYDSAIDRARRALSDSEGTPETPAEPEAPGTSDAGAVP